MGLTLAQMQLEAEMIYTVDDSREQLNRLVEYCISISPSYEQDLIRIEGTRHLSVDILREQKVFFLDDMDITYNSLPEEFRDEALGFIYKKHPIFNGRVIYPVMDVRHDVMGLCGWDSTSLPKYLDSRNQGYKAKLTTFYGMEKLPEYYRSKLPTFFVEGIVCALYLRSVGFNACAFLGSHLTRYVIEIIKRFGDRAIIIPDNDDAGNKLVQQCKFTLPMAIIAQMTKAKDIDDSRLLDDSKYENQLIEELRGLTGNPYLRKEMIRIR